MSVAHDAVSESHTGTTGVASVASFTWDHVPTGTPRSALVFTLAIGANPVTSVTYGGTSMTAVPYTAYDSDTEPGFVQAWFLDNCGTGTKAVVVNRTNNAVVTYATCMTQTAASACEVYLAGVKTVAGSGSQQTAASSSGTGVATAYAAMTLDDGSPGTNSIRYLAIHNGGSSVATASTNVTSNGTSASIDFGLYTFATYRETTPSQGAKSLTVGTIADDLAVIGLAVREKTPVTGSFTANAVIKKTITPTFAADAVIKRTMPIAGASFTADAWKSVNYAFTDKKADAVLFKTLTPTFSANSVLFKNSGTKTFTADAIIRKTILGPAFPSEGLSYTARGAPTKAFVADNFVSVSPTGTLAAGTLAVVLATHSSGRTSSVSDTAGNTWTEYADSESLYSSIHSRVFTSVLTTQLTTGDTVTLTLSSSVSSFKFFTLWEVSSTGQPPRRSTGGGATGASVRGGPFDITTALADGEILIAATGIKYGTGTYIDDADTLDGTWSTSQLSKDGTYAGSSTGGLIAQAKSLTGSSAQTYNGRISIGVSADWAGTWISVANSTTGFTSNAVIAKTLTPTFAADAVLAKSASGTFAANAVFAKPASGTFAAAAIIGKTQLGSLTFNAVIKASVTGTKTADAIRLRTFHFGSGVW